MSKDKLEQLIFDQTSLTRTECKEVVEILEEKGLSDLFESLLSVVEQKDDEIQKLLSEIAELEIGDYGQCYRDLYDDAMYDLDVARNELYDTREEFSELQRTHDRLETLYVRLKEQLEKLGHKWDDEEELL